MSYRPITDSWDLEADQRLWDEWILCRSKVKYYGAYPAGFLHRARQLLGVSTQSPVLHVCGGKIREYPFRGFGDNDRTLDLDPECNPDFLRDARERLPEVPDILREAAGDVIDGLWPAVLIDRPYTKEDAEHYKPGPEKLPEPNLLIKNGVNAVQVGGKVGMLDYIWPSPPKNATEVAVISVYTGRNNRVRVFTVFERLD